MNSQELANTNKANARNKRILEAMALLSGNEESGAVDALRAALQDVDVERLQKANELDAIIRAIDSESDPIRSTSNIVLNIEGPRQKKLMEDLRYHLRQWLWSVVTTLRQEFKEL